MAFSIPSPGSSLNASLVGMNTVPWLDNNKQNEKQWKTIDNGSDEDKNDKVIPLTLLAVFEQGQDCDEHILQTSWTAGCSAISIIIWMIVNTVDDDGAF